jgi:hypothetical protein
MTATSAHATGPRPARPEADERRPGWAVAAPALAARIGVHRAALAATAVLLGGVALRLAGAVGLFAGTVLLTGGIAVVNVLLWACCTGPPANGAGGRSWPCWWPRRWRGRPPHAPAWSMPPPDSGPSLTLRNRWTYGPTNTLRFRGPAPFIPARPGWRA